MKREWMMVNRCSLCKASEKSNNHILIHCERTRRLWTFLLAIFSLKWVFPAIIKNLLLKGKFRRHVWQMDPLCLLWCIWKEQNHIIFNGEELSNQRLKKNFIKSLWERSHVSLKMGNFLLMEFLNSLNSG